MFTFKCKVLFIFLKGRRLIIQTFEYSSEGKVRGQEGPWRAKTSTAPLRPLLFTQDVTANFF